MPSAKRTMFWFLQYSCSLIMQAHLYKLIHHSLDIHISSQLYTRDLNPDHLVSSFTFNFNFLIIINKLKKTISLSLGITRSPGRKTSTLVVKVAGGRRPRLCDIPTGCALWIPEKQARQLYSQGYHFFDQQEADMRDSSPNHGERESLCMHGAPTSPSRNTDIDDAESQHLTKSSEEFRQISAASLSTRERGKSIVVLASKVIILRVQPS